jgi:tRNA nucleotidyltransferase (CCA-adding enzyme)
MNMVAEREDQVLPRHVREKILDAVMPDSKELEIITRTSGELMERITEKACEMGISGIEPVMAGSVAKGTISGKPDLDVFLIFPRGTKKIKLEEDGIRIAEAVLDSSERRYTQHPYITGKFKGMNADIVPCLRIIRGDPVSTAVDRTPHHTQYITSRMKPFQKEEAVLLKSFFKGIGSYGAEDTVNGFSGYLCELLILYFGNFSAVVRWFSELDVARIPPEKAEISGNFRFIRGNCGPLLFNRSDLLGEKPLDRVRYIKRFPDCAMILIDPVDPGRNVASPVSDQTLAHTAAMSVKLLKQPGWELFSPFSRRPNTFDGELTTGSEITMFSLPVPGENPDLVMTQVRSFLSRILKAMEREGDWKVEAGLILAFSREGEIDDSYLKARYSWSLDHVDEPSIIISLKTVPPSLEKLFRHEGPPASNTRAVDFIRKWGNKIEHDEESDRLFVMARRKHTDPGPMFLALWEEIKLGSAFKGIYPQPVENQLIHEVIREALGR